MTNDWPEITKDTSLEELREIHKYIWNYVLKNGNKPNTPYLGDCLLCHYDFLKNKVNEKADSFKPNCFYCPAANKLNYCDGYSIYEKWKHSKRFSQEWVDLTCQIRDVLDE